MTEYTLLALRRVERWGIEEGDLPIHPTIDDLEEWVEETCKEVSNDEE